MNENPKNVVWAVVTTHTLKSSFGGLQIFAREEDAQRTADTYNRQVRESSSKKGGHPTHHLARVIRCEVK